MQSTVKIAKQVGIPLRSLMRWIAEGKIKAPRLCRVENISVRLWSEADIRRLQRYHKAHFREGMGQRTDLKGKQSQRRKKRR